MPMTTKAPRAASHGAQPWLPRATVESIVVTSARPAAETEIPVAGIRWSPLVIGAPLVSSRYGLYDLVGTSSARLVSRRLPAVLGDSVLLRSGPQCCRKVVVISDLDRETVRPRYGGHVARGPTGAGKSAADHAWPVLQRCEPALDRAGDLTKDGGDKVAYDAPQAPASRIVETSADVSLLVQRGVSCCVDRPARSSGQSSRVVA